MVTVIKKDTNREKANKQLDEALQSRGVDTHKYCVNIQLKEDPLVIQMKMRDEWK